MSLLHHFPVCVLFFLNIKIIISSVFFINVIFLIIFYLFLIIIDKILDNIKYIFVKITLE